MTELREPNRVEQQILDAITEAVRTRGYPPSMKELCVATGLRSTSTIAYRLTAMEAAGFITRAPNCPRAITVLAGRTA